jgi:hypothetical protein
VEDQPTGDEQDVEQQPTYSSKLKRLETKGKRAGVKSLRGKPRGDD